MERSPKFHANQGNIFNCLTAYFCLFYFGIRYFRPSGSTVLRRVSGPRQDGCRPCPRGRYGDRMGLKHSTCSGLCPVGTYGDKEGLTSILECKACPTGTFGARSGLTSSLCSGKCPKGYYTDLERSTSCKKCPLHYTGSQCVDI